MSGWALLALFGISLLALASEIISRNVVWLVVEAHGLGSSADWSELVHQAEIAWIFALLTWIATAGASFWLVGITARGRASRLVEGAS